VGHGIDVVEIARIARMIDDHADRFLERCFTSGERECVGARGARRSGIFSSLVLREGLPSSTPA